MLTAIIAFFDRRAKRLGISPDPVRHCALYKDQKAGSCAHVDGFLCDMESCSSLAWYQQQRSDKEKPA